jgi:hypothetical protein
MLQAGMLCKPVCFLLIYLSSSHIARFIAIFALVNNIKRMKPTHYNRIIMVLMICLVTLSVSAQKKATIYAFGFAGSFTDSVVYITDVQRIDSATLTNKTSFLIDRAKYSQQLKSYMETNLNQQRRTCAFFYDTKKAKVEKAFAKIKKRYLKDKTLLVKFIGADQFTYKAVKDTGERTVEVTSESEK